MKGKTITGIFQSLTILRGTHIRILKVTFHELWDGNKNRKLSSNYSFYEYKSWILERAHGTPVEKHWSRQVVLNRGFVEPMGAVKSPRGAANLPTWPSITSKLWPGVPPNCFIDKEGCRDSKKGWERLL